MDTEIAVAMTEASVGDTVSLFSHRETPNDSGSNTATLEAWNAKRTGGYPRKQVGVGRGACDSMIFLGHYLVTRTFRAHGMEWFEVTRGGGHNA